jgi:2-polyprenyl-6-methoxyphenol hydroxylase-like FAD-dependent oxidoreductase
VIRPTGILVAGAGPAGLAFALQAHDHGADVRVIERRHEAYRPSRALILHSRTLEVLRPLGVTQALLARADIAPTVDLHLGHRAVRVRLADLALPDTAFPHLSLIRQMDVETVLAQALAVRGIEVERGTELTGVHDGPEGVRAALRSGAGLTQARFGFVVGCDGPTSTVRSSVGIGWRGRPYAVEVVLADAELTGDLAVMVPMLWPGGTAWCSCSALVSGRRGGCSPPGLPGLMGCRSGSPARRSRLQSFRSCWPKRAWARRSPTLPGPRGSGCSTGWPGSSAGDGCSWPATRPTPTPRQPARG